MTEHNHPTIPPPPPGSEDNYVCEKCGLTMPHIKLRCPRCRTMPAELRRDYRNSYLYGFATWIPDAFIIAFMFWDFAVAGTYREPDFLTSAFRLVFYSMTAICWLLLAWFSMKAYIRVSRRIKRWWWI